MIAVYVPVYNEERDLAQSLELIAENINKIDSNYQLVIVDDNSSDGSQSVVRQHSRKNPRIKLMRYYFGPSRREALNLALQQCEADIVGMIDADLPMDPSYLKQFDSNIQEFDIIIGSRWISGAKVRREVSRWILSGFLNLFVRFLFFSKVRDHWCGLKMFRGRALRAVLSTVPPSKYRGILWDAEIIVRAQRLGYRIKEVPVSWKARRGSKVNMTTLIKSRDILSSVYLFKLWVDIFVRRKLG